MDLLGEMYRSVEIIADRIKLPEEFQMKSYRFIVKGKVQGVWYRKSVQEFAEKAGFNGYIRNLSNGSVEAVVTCDERKLKEFTALLQRGSSLSHVEETEMTEIEETFKNGFVVR